MAGADLTMHGNGYTLRPGLSLEQVMTETIKSTTKGAVKSKTNWLGLSVLLLTYAQGNLDKLSPMVTDAHLQLAGFVIGALIIVNRFATSKPLAEK